MVSDVIVAKCSEMDRWERWLEKGRYLGHNTLEAYIVDTKEWSAGG